MSCCHPSIARCLTFFTITVRTHMTGGHAMRSHGEAQLAYAHEQHVHAHLAAQTGEQAALGEAASPRSASGSGGFQPSAAAHALPGQDGQPSSGREAAAFAAAAAEAPSTGPTTGLLLDQAADTIDTIATLSGGSATATNSSLSSTGSAAEGFMTLLVMEYCSLGNLHHAIAAGRLFLDRRLRMPNMDWIIRTALDVAEGLAHLHDRRNLVHRDISTNNVLLVPDPSDPRGFRAKLADFGLSTVLRERRTHKTSQLKGTVDFMPPEIFTCGEIRFAVDVYALGVVVFWMCKGEGPYTGLAPFQVVGRKLEEVHRRLPLALPPNMPKELQKVVWDCTHWEPYSRPSAAEVARRLKLFLSQLDKEESRGRRHSSW